MIGAISSYASSVPTSSNKSVSQQIRVLESQLGVLQKQLAQAAKNASSKDGAREVQQIKLQIAVLEARIAQLKAQLADSTNSTVSVQPSAKSTSTAATRPDSSRGNVGNILDIYA